MSDTRTPSDSPDRDAACNDAREEMASLREQLVEQLASLQQTYQQAREWIETMQLQLSSREQEVKHHLEAALDLVDRSIRPSPWPTSEAHSDPEPPALQVRTLGQFQVLYDGQHISLGSNHNGRALFRYLVATPQRRAHKDVLMALFWPDDTPKKANHKLHIAISSLRQALTEVFDDGSREQAPILFADDYYFLSPELPIALDIDAFSTHLSAARSAQDERQIEMAMAEYEAARATYRGDFMAQDLYADWTIAPRARFEEMYLSLLGELANYYVDQGQYTDSIECCRQILARDSFREDAYRQLMRCYSRMGRRNQALIEFRSCTQVLQNELGVAPTRETKALYERLLARETL